MFFVKRYQSPFNWYAVLAHLEVQRVASYAFFNSNDSTGKGYLFLAPSSKKIDLEDVDTESECGAFGYLGYDLKNNFEKLVSNNKSFYSWPEFEWIEAELMIEFTDDQLQCYGENTLFETHIEPYLNQDFTDGQSQKANLNQTTSRKDYITIVERLKQHIQLGDVYEINYCLNFTGIGELNPVSTFKKLESITSAPFSALMKLGNKYIISGSPERFLKREGTRLTSQPIKGTARRDSDPEKDKLLSEALSTSSKERSENIMIVDLVRNDLSRVAEKGTVEVVELCGVYTFRTVHQLISTISCSVSDHVGFEEILRALFPMGSMTGAPKISAMQLIEENEAFKRGVYSGSIGFFKPNGDFDLSVVIRSILYDSDTLVYSAPAGGAITMESDPELEYEECMLKSDAMKRALC